MKCLYCKSSNTVRRGKRSTKSDFFQREVFQRFECRDCKRYFSDGYTKKRIPDKVISKLLSKESVGQISKSEGVNRSQIYRWCDRDDYDDERLTLVKVRCIQLELEGLEELQISKFTGVHLRVVTKWLERFRDTAIECLPKLNERVSFKEVIDDSSKQFSLFTNAEKTYEVHYQQGEEPPLNLRLLQCFLNGVNVNDMKRHWGEKVSALEEMKKLCLSSVPTIKYDKIIELHKPEMFKFGVYLNNVRIVTTT